METQKNSQNYILLKLFRLLLGSILIFLALNSGPPRFASFDSLTNFLSFTFFGALFFLAFFVIGFAPESKIKKRLEIINRLSPLRRYVGTFLIFYGIFMPGLHHVNRIFQDQYYSLKLPTACLVFFVGLLLLGFHVEGPKAEDKN